MIPQDPGDHLPIPSSHQVGGLGGPSAVLTALGASWPWNTVTDVQVRFLGPVSFGWWQLKYFFGCFQPRKFPGVKWNPIWRVNIFQRGWLKPPTRQVWWLFEVPKTFVCLRWVFFLLSTMVNHHFATICGICLWFLSNHLKRCEDKVVFVFC